MTWSTFVQYMALLSKNYSKNIFNPYDSDMAKLWYTMLEHFSDEVFIAAAKKIMINEVFAPNLATLSKYCSETSTPIDIEPEEGWGLVQKAIRRYGYMQADEAMQSLPPIVQRAVLAVGGFQGICESCEIGIIRGQFNKAMTSITEAEKTRRRSKEGQEEALKLENMVKDLNLLSYDWERAKKETVEEGLELVHEAYDTATKGAREEREENRRKAIEQRQRVEEQLKILKEKGKLM